jgi:hypothetical protein
VGGQNSDNGDLLEERDAEQTVDPNSGFVYMQTNEPERNRLLGFKRASDGTLTPSAVPSPDLTPIR